MAQHIPILIRSDFPGGNGAHPVEIEPDHWQVEPQGDVIYGAWYYVELINPGPYAREICLDVTGIPDVPGVASQADRPVCRVDDGPWFPLASERIELAAGRRTRSFEEPVVWFWEREEPVPADRRRDYPTVEVHLRLDLPPRASLRVAATYPYLPRDLDALAAWLEHLPPGKRPLVRVHMAGLSEEGRPILELLLTDPAVPAAEKQVLAITARHHPALEDSGSWCSEGIVEWLLSGQPEAQAILRGWTVAVFPLVNPDSVQAGQTHFNANGVDLFMDYEDLSTAEVRAVVAELDRLQPDFFIDFHGWALHQEGSPPHDGSYLDLLNSRPWDSAVYEVLARAWRKRIYGFASYALYRSIFASCSAGAAYWRWHSLGIVTEINPGGCTVFQIKERAVDNLRAIVETLSARWPGYPAAGVPNREILRTGSASVFAWGADRAAIRASRVALWRGRAGLSVAEVEPGVYRACLAPPAGDSVTAALRVPAPAAPWAITVDGAPAAYEGSSDGWLFVPVVLGREPVTVTVSGGSR